MTIDAYKTVYTIRQGGHLLVEEADSLEHRPHHI